MWSISSRICSCTYVFHYIYSFMREFLLKILLKVFLNELFRHNIEEKILKFCKTSILSKVLFPSSFYFVDFLMQYLQFFFVVFREIFLCEKYKKKTVFFNQEFHQFELPLNNSNLPFMKYYPIYFSSYNC